MLAEVCERGRDPRYICQKASVKNDQPASISLRSNPIVADTNMSSDEDEDDELASTASGSNNTKQDSVESAP